MLQISIFEAMLFQILAEAKFYQGDASILFSLFIFALISFLYFKRNSTKRATNKKHLTVRAEVATPDIRNVLNEHHHYYQNLDEENKARFERRVGAFILEKDFIPKAYSEVTDEMKALISAAAIQLTFGFEHLNFTHFEKILIYKDPYFSRLTGQYHKGEVNPQGLIVLSWLNIKEGFLHPHDGINLALHEMAHALHLENGIENEEYDFISKKVFNDFKRLANHQRKLIKLERTTFFRSYAAVNEHEFFAVCVENFFERPLTFRDYNEELYTVMTVILKQDPIRLFNLN